MGTGRLPRSVEREKAMMEALILFIKWGEKEYILFQLWEILQSLAELLK